MFEIIFTNHLHKIRKSFNKRFSGLSIFEIVSKYSGFITLETQEMHPTAKALYETAFYYLWGQRSAKQKVEMAIGIDRDHNHFQHVAWGYGYHADAKKREAATLLYARRAPEKDRGSALSDYRLRQFWR